jgi:anti-sigma-K factor RskA
MNAEIKLNESRRIAILLADRAVQTLHDAEFDELESLLAHHPEIDDTELDEAAGALHLAKPLLPESMPDSLRARVFADAERFFGAPKAAVVVESITQETVSEIETDASVELAAVREDVVDPHITPVSLPITHAANILPMPRPESRLTEREPLKEQTINANPAPTAEVVAFPSSPQPSGRVVPAVIEKRSNLMSRMGWLAAAACLTFAMVGVWKVRQQQKEIVALRAANAAPNYAAQRQALIAQGGEVIQLNWAAATYPGMQRVKGDVVWSDTTQKGYMRFVGMPANDPNEVVYQLWIFAANQDEKYPIDGGVFNITSNGEIIVPINAKLQVSKPGLFAITIEKPGGVVVSKRDKLALLAKVG